MQGVTVPGGIFCHIWNRPSYNCNTEAAYTQVHLAAHRPLSGPCYHHYFPGNSDRRLNIIPLKNRSVYLVICCAIRLHGNYNGAELLDNYELLPGERFRVNIDPQRQSLGIHGRLVISTVLSSIARANCVAEYKNANSVEKICCTFVRGDKDLVLFLCFPISAS